MLKIDFGNGSTHYKCGNCSKDIDSHDKFCKSCGYKLDVKSAVNAKIQDFEKDTWMVVDTLESMRKDNNADDEVLSILETFKEIKVMLGSDLKKRLRNL